MTSDARWNGRGSAAALSLAALIITGCTTTPSPTEQIAPGNFQARLTRVTGAVEGGATFIGGGVQGDGCVLTVLGELQDGVSADLTAEGCSATLLPEPAVP